MSEGKKFDGGKPKLAMVLGYFSNAIRLLGEVGTYGNKKYASGYHDHNWMEVENAVERYRDAAARHFLSYLGGEKIDTESGLPHLSHASWNLNALTEIELEYDKFPVHNVYMDEGIPTKEEIQQMCGGGGGMIPEPLYINKFNVDDLYKVLDDTPTEDDVDQAIRLGTFDDRIQEFVSAGKIPPGIYRGEWFGTSPSSAGRSGMNDE
jgi:Domain of unknown function (DUF5664)